MKCPWCGTLMVPEIGSHPSLECPSCGAYGPDAGKSQEVRYLKAVARAAFEAGEGMECGDIRFVNISNFEQWFAAEADKVEVVE